MSDLTGKNIKDTYKDLLKVTPASDNTGIDGTDRVVTDGDGTATPLKLSTTKVKTDAVDIGGGTIDDTPIGSEGRSTGEFSQIGVGGEKNTPAQTKIHDNDTKTTLQMGEVIFEKTGVVATHITTKNVYEWLKIDLHDELTAGNFLLEVELCVTSGRDGRLPWGTDASVTPLGAIAATYNGSGTFTSSNHGLSAGMYVGLYNMNAAQPANGSGISAVYSGVGSVVSVPTADTFQITDLDAANGWSNSDSGHFKANGDFQAYGQIPTENFIADGEKFGYLKSTAIGMHIRIDGTNSVVPTGSGASPKKHKVVLPDISVHWDSNSATNSGFLCGTRNHYRPEAHRVLYAYKYASPTSGTAYNFGESSEDKGNSATAGAPYSGQDGVNIWADNSCGIKYPKTSDMYSWIEHNDANPSGHTKVDTRYQPVWGNNDSYDNNGSNSNGGVDASWNTANTERTWEPYYQLLTPESGEAFWKVRFGSTSGWYSAQDGDAHQIMSISYNI